MASPKKEQFTKEENEIASFAKAISHPARIAILNKLAEKNMCVCGEIVEVLPLSQSTVSQHLKELKEQGIIQGTIDGPKSCYCINWKVLSSKLELLNNYTNTLKSLNKKINSQCC
ncbi:MAG: metalloregulator ArsR/SmtB family transcription factor [Ignavibacteria bacterium]|nr:metalloregulator ArsR/SmtB family transcription factor [Ignavibacteria bacterium]